MRITLIKVPFIGLPSGYPGEHTFTYALLPPQRIFIGEAVKRGLCLKSASQGEKGAFPPRRGKLCLFDTEEVELDAVKRSEDGTSLVIRFHE